MKAWIVFIFFLLTSSAFANVYTIQFGGIHGYSYFPNMLNVFVGDTVEWVGDFSAYTLQSTSVPSGASSFGPINTGDTFQYIVRFEGTYNYQDTKYISLGMSGSFSATKHHYGICNDGREFYLGLLFPSYNNVEPSIYYQYFRVSALVSTHYANEISVSYFEPSGKEGAEIKYQILAGASIALPLDVSSMKMDTASDVPAYRSCHIKSLYPISVMYASVGPCAGGSYLVLPVLGLGKNYVAASYNDNPGLGAYYYTTGATMYDPTSFDYAAGEFEIIATEDGTNVKITPTTATITGHPGVVAGVAHPYTITLNRGQCYLVRSTGKSDENDMSGSLIEASKPVAVISGNENAYLGGTDPYFMEGRDYMVEQMLPAEFWDSIGYVSAPLAEATPPGTEGAGDSYRIYEFDTVGANVHLNVQGISGGYDLPTHRLTAPPEKTEVAVPVEAYSTNGKKIFLMQYDERSVTPKAPWPAPSMMSIIPVSRWKRNYSFYLFPNPNTEDYKFVNILSTNLSSINVSTDGTTFKPISSLSKFSGFINLSSQFPSITAGQYKFQSSGQTYTLSSNTPFMVYFYGMSDVAGDHLGAITTDYSRLQHISEFAVPAGTQLNTGVTPTFKVDTEMTCTGWHICISDTGANDPGVKAAMLIDDPDGIYWDTPAKFSNVTFDQNSSDYADGELHPHWHTNSAYCFDVNFQSPLASAFAPLSIVDNLGNAIILQLHRTAPTVKLTTTPPTSSRADSIVFPVKQIGTQICTTFVLKNTAPKNGTAINLNSALLTNSDTSFKASASISFPHSLAAGDSAAIQVCYTPRDSSRHQDTLILRSDCFSIPISLDAHGSTGLISASDLSFGTVNIGDTSCKAVEIKNVGSAPFTLTGDLFSDTVNFTVASKPPTTINPGGSVFINVCFHPQSAQSYFDSIVWNTDLESAFRHSLKSYSTVTGQGQTKAGVRSNTETTSFSIRPNPTNGNFVIVTLGSTSANTLTVFDVLGREVYRNELLSGIPQLRIPIQNLPEGTYYVRLSSERGTSALSFIKVK
jgi:plastocyanin